VGDTRRRCPAVGRGVDGLQRGADVAVT